jgi:hypothetical protein
VTELVVLVAQVSLLEIVIVTAALKITVAHVITIL